MRGRAAPALRLCVAAVVFFLLTVPIHAEEAPDDASGWGRFGVGTMIHHSLTTEMTFPGRAPHLTVQETKKTLARITDAHYVLKIETLLQGNWTTTEEKISKDRTSGALSKIVPFAAAGSGSVSTTWGTSYPMTFTWSFTGSVDL